MAKRGAFGRMGFVLAAAGSAVGLGNIWKFPYITYANEGGSFVLVYLLAIVAIGAPLMIAEILIGRRAQRSAVGAVAAMAQATGFGPRASRSFSGIGWLGIASGFVILSFYSVVAGWTLYYFGKCLWWSWHGFSPADAQSLGPMFSDFLADGRRQIFFHSLFSAFTMGVVMLGIEGGIEKASKILMPLLFGILSLLLLAASQWDGFSAAWRFLFHFGPINAEGILEAVGHAFFTLSLGMGAMITYGSYVSPKSSIPRSALVICLLDTLIALMASMVMFTIIFSIPEAERATSFSKSASIMFTTLPRMFYALPGGVVLAPVFFLLVGFGALTSTISLLEVVVSYFIDELGWSRKKATLIMGGLIFATGVPAALSLGAHGGLSSWAPLREGTAGVFDNLDYLASNWMLPIGGLCIALFAAFGVKSSITRTELEVGHGPWRAYGMWRLLLGLATPSAILWIVWNVIQGHRF